jgi:hypothetical protein
MFNCITCNKSFTTNQSLNYHTNKQVCNTNNIFKCNCGKQYKSQKWYDKHINICENKVAPKLSQNSPKLSQNSPKLSKTTEYTSDNKYPNNDCPHCGKHYIHSRNIPRHIRLNCKKVTTLTTTNNQPSSNTNINNGTINQIVTNNNIVLSNFGDPDIDYLTNSMKRELCGRGYSCIQAILQEICFNDNHPENKTIRIKSEKRNEIEIYKNNKWNRDSIENGVTELIKLAFDLLDDFVETNGLTSRCKRKINEFCQKYDADLDDIQNRLNKTIAFLCKTNR